MNKTTLFDWEIIPKNINEMVKFSGKTKTQISKEIGVTKSALNSYASGRRLPSLVTLKALCKVLDCTYEDILD